MCELTDADSLRHCLEHVGNQGEVAGGRMVSDVGVDHPYVDGSTAPSTSHCCDSYIDSRYVPEDPRHLERAVVPDSVDMDRTVELDKGKAVHRSAKPTRRKVDGATLKVTHVFIQLKSHGFTQHGESPQRIGIVV